MANWVVGLTNGKWTWYCQMSRECTVWVIDDSEKRGKSTAVSFRTVTFFSSKRHATFAEAKIEAVVLSIGFQFSPLEDSSGHFVRMPV